MPQSRRNRHHESGMLKLRMNFIVYKRKQESGAVEVLEKEGRRVFTIINVDSPRLLPTCAATNS